MACDQPALSDERALRILFKTFWSASGWRQVPETSSADFQYAKAAGYMFDPIRLSHDTIIARACGAREATPPRVAANAFIASLSTRQLQLRSALGSYATARHLRPHAFEGDMFCNVCGVFSGSDREIDLNVLNFERYKWGGVRHEDPIYMFFDLEQFASIAKPSPSIADVQLFRRILSVVGQVTEQERAKDLAGNLRGVFLSNKSEREQLIRILSYCGILRSSGVGSYFDVFVSYNDRDVHSLVWDRSTASWRGKEGLALKPLLHYFGHLDLM
jgi:hypothetical protein